MDFYVVVSNHGVCACDMLVTGGRFSVLVLCHALVTKINNDLFSLDCYKEKKVLCCPLTLRRTSDSRSWPNAG